METFVTRLLLDALVETCNTERLTRPTLPLAGGGMTDFAESSNKRLPLRFVAILRFRWHLRGGLHRRLFAFLCHLDFLRWFILFTGTGGKTAT